MDNRQSNADARALKVLRAIRDELSSLDKFDNLDAPPEPGTAKSRAFWAAIALQQMIWARTSLLALSTQLNGEGSLTVEILGVKKHVQEVVSSRNLEYVKYWMSERGVSWKEMLRPQEAFAGMSWKDLLNLNDLV